MSPYMYHTIQHIYDTASNQLLIGYAAIIVIVSSMYYACVSAAVMRGCTICFVTILHLEKVYIHIYIHIYML
jgi:hypothetical protein